MFDLTIGEAGKILRLALTSLDQTVSPPVTNPLDLTGCTVTLQYTIGDLYGETVVERLMAIQGSPTLGIVQYGFQAGDLVAPGDFNQTGKFQYVVKVVFPGGQIMYSSSITTLTIKQKVGT